MSTSTIWSSQFWKATTERVIASIAGGALSVVGADAVFNVLDADWQTVGAIGLGAGVVSLLKAVASGAAGGGPSVTGSERLTIPDGPGERRKVD